MNASEIKIYGLVNPEIPDVIRYVGITKRTLQLRINEHWCSRKSRNTPIANWIKSLANKNLKPEIKLIDICKFEYWEDYERFYIKYFNKLGNRLLNYEPGGKTIRVFAKYRKMNVDPRKKSVLQFDLNTGELLNEYESVAEAGRQTGNIGTVIGFACKGEQKQAYGYHWEFKNIPWVSKLKGTTRAKKVEQRDTNNNIITTFASVTEASKNTKYSESYISARCRGESSTGPYGWNYITNN